MPLVRWWRRPPRAPAREASLKLTELADAMEEHFRRQDQRAAELAGWLERMGGTLERLAAAQQAQGEFLRSIAGHAEAASKHSAALATTLGRVPESLLAQAEAIRTVARQLEIGHEADNQLMHSLQQFGRAVDTLGSSGTAQVEVLQRLSNAQGQQHEAFAGLVREQGRRFLALAVIAAVLALAALAALAVTIWLQAFGR